jgi:hypothetical protein
MAGLFFAFTAPKSRQGAPRILISIIGVCGVLTRPMRYFTCGLGPSVGHRHRIGWSPAQRQLLRPLYCCGVLERMGLLLTEKQQMDKKQYIQHHAKRHYDRCAGWRIEQYGKIDTKG